MLQIALKNNMPVKIKYFKSITGYILILILILFIYFLWKHCKHWLRPSSILLRSRMDDCVLRASYHDLFQKLISFLEQEFSKPVIRFKIFYFYCHIIFESDL